MSVLHAALSFRRRPSIEDQISNSPAISLVMRLRVIARRACYSRKTISAVHVDVCFDRSNMRIPRGPSSPPLREYYPRMGNREHPPMANMFKDIDKVTMRDAIANINIQSAGAPISAVFDPHRLTHTDQTIYVASMFWSRRHPRTPFMIPTRRPTETSAIQGPG